MLSRPEERRRAPTLFVGHGSPMNAVEDNPWSRALHSLSEHLPRPRILFDRTPAEHVALALPE